VRVLDDWKDPGGQAVAVFRKPPEPAASCADCRELRGNVQTGQQNQEGDDERSQ
jgi:hypothetical protein